jgi:hypothetical protein
MSNTYMHKYLSEKINKQNQCTNERQNTEIFKLFLREGINDSFENKLLKNIKTMLRNNYRTQFLYHFISGM